MLEAIDHSQINAVAKAKVERYFADAQTTLEKTFGFGFVAGHPEVLIEYMKIQSSVEGEMYKMKYQEEVAVDITDKICAHLTTLTVDRVTSINEIGVTAIEAARIFADSFAKLNAPAKPRIQKPKKKD